MSDGRILLIVNPVSGRSIDILPAVDEIFKNAGADFDIKLTEKRRQATELARAAARHGYRRVIAVGGDGTVNEVASGLVNSDAILAVIPAGRGNDFFRMLSIPCDLETICRVALTGAPRSLDVGLLGDQPFFNSVGIGFAARAAGIADLNEKKKFSYLLAIYKALKENVAYEVALRIDNLELKLSVSMLTVNIGKTGGGGLPLAPLAEAEDGKFDVCVVESAKKTRIFTMLPRFLKGTHLRLPEVKMFRCRQIEISSSQPLPIHYEGEPWEGKSGRIRIKMDSAKIKVATMASAKYEH